MAPHRQVQHRSRREATVANTELRELRSQNQKLRRENARLRKEFSKRFPESIPEPEEAVETAPPPKPETQGCPHGCGVELRQVLLPIGKTLFVCTVCQWREAR